MADDKYLIEGHYYQYDLKWLIDKLLEFEDTVKTIVDLQTIHYADPIQWDITTQYSPNTVVVNPKNGTAYMSKKAVPAGIQLDNTDYWVIIFNYQKIYDDIMSGVAFVNGDSGLATKDIALYGLVWDGTTLYRATRAISAGSKLIEGTNMVKTSIESLLANYYGVDRTAQLQNDTLNVSGDYTINAGDIATTSDNLTTKVVKDRETDVDGSDSLHVDGASTVNVGGLRTEVYASNRGVGVRGNMQYDFKTVDMTVGSSTFPIKFPDKIVDLYKLDSRISVKNYGAKGDGITDDTDAIKAAVSALTERHCLYFPEGTYLISDTLNMPSINDFMIMGDGSSRTTLMMNGNTTAISIGSLSAETHNVHVLGLSFDSVNTQTDGYAIIVNRVTSWSTLNDIRIGTYGATQTSKPFKGIAFRATNVTYLSNFQIQTTDTAIEVSGWDPNIVGSDLFINSGFIAHSGKGIHCGGGFGGLYVDNTLIFGGNVGYYESNELCDLTNREIFLTETVCIDACDQYLARFNEPKSSNVFVDFRAFLSGAGYNSSKPDKQYACNFSIVSCPYGKISISSAVIKSAIADGINISDATTELLISPTTIIAYNGGYGINSLNETRNVYNLAKMNNNTSGNMRNVKGTTFHSFDYTPDISTSAGTTVTTTDASGSYTMDGISIQFHCKATISGATGILQVGGLPYGAKTDTSVTGFDITNNKPILGYIPQGWNAIRAFYPDGTTPQNCTLIMDGDYTY